MSLNTTHLSLDDRIAAAFADGAKSDDVAALIKETKGASLSANEVAEQARERALDPALSAKEVAEVRRQMEDAAFARDRLSAAVPRLQDRLKELRAAEEDARRQAAYEKAEAERDGLAEELARVYPEIERILADLIARLHASDKKLAGVNLELPRSSDRLRSAEEVARGLRGFSDGGTQVPRLTDMRLPAFDHSYARAYAWAPGVGTCPAGPGPA